jgi:RNA polymerase sigma-70 factor, ECF subfamily
LIYPESTMAFIFKKKQNSSDDLADVDIIELYRNTRDTKLIGVLFDRYAHLVYGISLKYFDREDDRKEAVMQVFEKLYEALLQFDIANFKSWLYSVAKNQCLMIIKKENTVSFNDQLQLKNFQQEFMEFEETFSLNHGSEINLEDKLHEVIKELNEEQRVCVDLFYLQDKSYKEISDATNYSYNQVKSFIQNGKRNLKIMLESIK